MFNSHFTAMVLALGVSATWGVDAQAGEREVRRPHAVARDCVQPEDYECGPRHMAPGAPVVMLEGVDHVDQSWDVMVERWLVELLAWEDDA